MFKNIALVPSQAPVVTPSGGSSTYTEDTPATTVDPSLTLSDADSSMLFSASVAITGNFATAEDLLTFTPIGGITGTYSAVDGVLRLSGTGSVADYETVLRSVKYQNTSNDPTGASRTIAFSVRDNADVKSNIGLRTVNVTAVNDAPVINPPGTNRWVSTRR